MQHLMTHKTVSLTEMRDPAKVIREAGDSPVAILNRNKVVGYFVPSTLVDTTSIQAADTDELLKALANAKTEMQPVLDYLQDK